MSNMKISKEETEKDWPIYVKAWREQFEGLCDRTQWTQGMPTDLKWRQTLEEFDSTQRFMEKAIEVGENFPDTKESMIEVITIILKRYPGYMRKGHMNRERKKNE